MSQSFCMSAHRRRTDLMPTITPGMCAREGSSSRASTPHRRNTPGRTVSMSRLDTLSRPRLHASSPNNNANQQPQHHKSAQRLTPNAAGGMTSSRSMSHLSPLPVKQSPTQRPVSPSKPPRPKRPIQRRSSAMAGGSRQRPEGKSSESSTTSKPPTMEGRPSKTNWECPWSFCSLSSINIQKKVW